MQQSDQLNASSLADDTADVSGVMFGSRDTSRLARLWTAVIVVLMCLNLVLFVWNIARTGDIDGFLSHQLLTPFLVMGYMLIGLVVVNKRPHNSIGWIFLLTGTLLGISALAAGIERYGSALPQSFVTSLVEPAQWLANWVWIPAQFLPFTLVLLLFPNGQLLRPYWRPVVVLVGLGLFLVMVGLALHPGPIEFLDSFPNPYGISGAEGFLTATMGAGAVMLLVGIFASLAAVLQRYHYSVGVERQQMKWLVLATIVFFALSIVSGFISGSENAFVREISIMLSGLATLGIVVAAGVAIVRYRLYDIEILVNRTLVYVVMTGIILIIYGAVVGGASVLFQTRSTWPYALVATGLIAVLFQPIHQRLQRGVNHLLYGQRDEPIEVLSQLAQRLELTLTPDSLYPTIVETVAQALRLPYVALEIKSESDGFTLAESYGRKFAEPLVLPLAHQGEVVGRLLIGPRSGDQEFSEADQQLLQNLARQAGAAVYGAKLTADLQRSRQQLVASREEERRRLRRDLHDGLGPALASLLLEARVLRRMIGDDPAAAEALADEMQGDIRATIDDIRRVVHELRPPALDDLGLVPALNVMAAKIGRSEGGTVAASDGLRVSIDEDAKLPQLPAAVEVAAYRIVQEALTNVVLHANAHCATVRLWLDRDLHIQIMDDGIGFAGGREGGLGLHSMRERAAELGGRWSIRRQPGGGTVVEATLPVGRAEAL